MRWSTLWVMVSQMASGEDEGAMFGEGAVDGGDEGGMMATAPR